MAYIEAGDGYERNAEDIDTHADVSAGAVADWRIARERWTEEAG